MRQVERIKDDKFHLETVRLLKIANKAVKEAKEENRKHGIPEYVFKNGRMYYVLASGDLSTIRPK